MEENFLNIEPKVITDQETGLVTGFDFGLEPTPPLDPYETADVRLSKEGEEGEEGEEGNDWKTLRNRAGADAELILNIEAPDYNSINLKTEPVKGLEARISMLDRVLKKMVKGVEDDPGQYNHERYAYGVLNRQRKILEIQLNRKLDEIKLGVTSDNDVHTVI